MGKLVIELQAGIVQNVRSDDPTLDVTLVDWDNIERGDLPEAYPLDSLMPTDTLLLAGINGDTTKMAEWFISRDSSRFSVCQHCGTAWETDEVQGHICLEMMTHERKT